MLCATETDQWKCILLLIYSRRFGSLLSQMVNTFVRITWYIPACLNKNEFRQAGMSNNTVITSVVPSSCEDFIFSSYQDTRGRRKLATQLPVTDESTLTVT